MRAIRLPNGNLRIPVAVQAEGAPDVIGDGIEEIGPDDPRFAEWARFADPATPNR